MRTFWAFGFDTFMCYGFGSMGLSSFWFWFSFCIWEWVGRVV
ncbi:unnamed protein product [Linum tenue]|uniref:Uncharacterized protein n=1 Tax=Linum tenue TaxID=586396 RepID=A0AAV0KPL9_9ROSI|nr:unnamed protein product [Linum tenue]